MSNWSHVAAIVRVDSFPRCLQGVETNFTKIFGKELSYEDRWNLDLPEVPDKDGEYLYYGSEGSLKMTVWVNPYKESLAAYTISIFGDLRDDDDPDAIIEWFKHKCSKLDVRQACITVDNEWRNKGRFWSSDEVKISTMF